MYCPSCGKENAEDAAFCSACGKALNTTNSSTNISDIMEKNESATVNTPVSKKAN